MVLGKPIAEVAKNVIMWIRLPILTPEEIEKLERDNKKDGVIPVRLAFIVILVLSKQSKHFKCNLAKNKLFFLISLSFFALSFSF